jgi:uncharacterized protein (DUF736 family)|tara:strand:+ start:549 stop:803 length:255 start_codon:yes stop_codon:yes gene_type:complete
MSQSTYEHKPGTGSMWKNPDATSQNNQPNWRGKIMLPDGTMQEIAGWEKITQSGDKFISCQLKDVYKKPEQKVESVKEDNTDLF